MKLPCLHKSELPKACDWKDDIYPSNEDGCGIEGKGMLPRIVRLRIALLVAAAVDTFRSIRMGEVRFAVRGVSHIVIVHRRIAHRQDRWKAEGR